MGLDFQKIAPLRGGRNFIFSSRKNFGNAEIFEKKVWVVAIDAFQKSSKSELSARFLSRLKLVLRAQEMSCFEHTECLASNARNVLLRTHGMSCFEHKECLDSNTRNVVPRKQGMSCFEHTQGCVSNTRNVLLRTQGMSCFKHIRTKGMS